MQSIDKNDVDVSRLFKWNKEVIVRGEDDKEILTVYMRLCGDAEINRARVYALRKSGEMRKKLHDKNSDEYLAFIPDPDIVEMENVIELLLMQWTREYAQDAVKEVKLILPVEPGSDVTLEQQEKYQEEIDNWPQMREQKIREFVMDKLDNKRKELEELPPNIVYKEYVKMYTNRLCEEEMIKGYREMCAYFGSYKDQELITRLCGSFEEFDNLTSDLKNQLIVEYMSLEMDGEELKK
jgi:hypothetical protein